MDVPCAMAYDYTVRLLRARNLLSGIFPELIARLIERISREISFFTAVSRFQVEIIQDIISFGHI